jgi:hypothetical protein
VEEVAHYGSALRIGTLGSVDPVELATRVLDARGLTVQDARETRVTVEDAFVAMVRRERARERGSRSERPS